MRKAQRRLIQGCSEEPASLPVGGGGPPPVSPNAEPNGPEDFAPATRQGKLFCSIPPVTDLLSMSAIRVLRDLVVASSPVLQEDEDFDEKSLFGSDDEEEPERKALAATCFQGLR